MNRKKTTNIEYETTNISPEKSEGPILRARDYASLLLILLSGLFIYTFRLGDSPLDRTEPFRALVADQMVHSGQWLIPRLYGEVYLRKPPLIYWVEAGMQKLAGHGNELIWRLPSALGSVVLAVFLAWWGGRWFGPKAVLPTGFASLALVALWDQNRSADIDALNTLAAVVTTACVLELVCGLGRRTALWSIALGLCLGATLLLKGPGGLPQILAASAGSALALRNWKKAFRPAIWVGYAIGLVIFAGYVVLVKLAMQQAGVAMDHTGPQEVMEKIFLHSWRSRLLSIVMPFTLLIYALPVSAALPFVVHLFNRRSVSSQRARAILGTLIVSCLIWIISGIDNPRYEYVMLPLLAPLVGLLWTASDRWDIPRMSIPVCILITGAGALITLKLPPMLADHVLVCMTEVISVALLLIWLVCMFRTNASARRHSNVVVVSLLLLLAVPMAERKNVERQKKSARNAAAEMRSIIGSAKSVASVGVVRDMPEIFYYTDVDVQSFGEAGLAALAQKARGQWVVISETEQYPAYSTLLNQVPGAFPQGLKKLHMPDARDRIYVGFYDPPANQNTRIEWSPRKQIDSED